MCCFLHTSLVVTTPTAVKYHNQQPKYHNAIPLFIKQNATLVPLFYTLKGLHSQCANLQCATVKTGFALPICKGHIQGPWCNNCINP